MKRWLVVFVMLWLGPGLLAQDNGADAASQAQAAYESGDFATAISLYEALVSSGVSDSRVFFNLGNAYYQSRDLGRALLNYRRAQMLNPRDGDTATSLSRIRSQRVDLQGDEVNLVDSVTSFTTGFMTTTELSSFTFLLWVGVCLMSTLYVLRVDLRPNLRGLLVFTSGVFLIGGVLLGCRLYVESQRQPAVLVENSIEVMSGPGGDYVVLYRLYSAAEMRILERRDGWVRFVLPDDRQGWLPESALSTV